MKYLFLILLSLTSCQDYNSNSGDRGRYGPVELDTTNERYAQAYAIIQTRCVSCHDHYHDRWAEFKSTSDWIGENYITPGNPDTSMLINYIINAGGTMPPGGSPLPNEEYNHLRDWVQNSL